MVNKPSWDNLFTYDTLVHAIAGSVGSATAMAAFYPLDTIRSRLQVEDSLEAKGLITMLRELVREEGFEALYRGLDPVITSLFASGFVYFYSFHGLRAVFYPDKQQSNAIKDLILGSVAGAINVLLTTPFWVVNTRMKMQGAKLRKDDEKLRKFPYYKGIFHGLWCISQTEGPKALWNGTLPSLVLVCNPAIQFMVYEQLKRRAQIFLQTDTLNGGVIFFLGAVAKSISTVITYPLQIVQSKLRVSSESSLTAPAVTKLYNFEHHCSIVRSLFFQYGSDDVKNKNMLRIFAEIVERNGAKGLYKGMEAKLVQTVLTTALMYLCYEKIALFVFQLLGSSRKRIK
ncbi:peroxisomal membrane protein PMP34-like protein [Dinothrombium tinctorium]|uniref:Peroxisomal membrane protein PMP34-like protein n=1 Tax=Dinothrombium tinctorium TaxID=1965070 RepID=A0A443RNQ9_9ACAR|nr:peroxisomal membrane protein PMP34-like protein [Dinothrombium tinctorium]